MCSKKLFFALLCGLASSVWAADACSFDIKSTDVMTWTNMAGKPIPVITVPARCGTFTINMQHIGKMPKTAMGHNVVVVKSSDIKGVIKDGMRYGISKDYLKPGDTRVLAASKMIGGGEKTSVKIPVQKIKDGDYLFFCSFLGHDRKMRGKLEVK
ncbi:MAG: azurin [Neisseriaceae bacterium]|nr:azurin [Neisseriaceae bacterium]